MTVYESRPGTPKEGDIYVYANRGKFFFLPGNPDTIVCEGNVAAEEYRNDRWTKIDKIRINTRFLDAQGERETLDHLITYLEGKLHRT